MSPNTLAIVVSVAGAPNRLQMPAGAKRGHALGARRQALDVVSHRQDWSAIGRAGLSDVFLSSLTGRGFGRVPFHCIRAGAVRRSRPRFLCPPDHLDRQVIDPAKNHSLVSVAVVSMKHSNRRSFADEQEGFASGARSV
jgi:hypothetical protein